MSWMSDRFARLRRAPRQQGAHARAPGARQEAGIEPGQVPEPQRVHEGLVLPAPRSGSDHPAELGGLLPVPTATATVLVTAPDDDVRFLLARRCQMSSHLRVVAESKEPVSALRAVHRLRPDLVVVQVQSTKETEAELITAVKEISPGSRVFVYSTLPGGAAVSVAMAAGADRYALAGAPLTTLMREIEGLVVPDRATAER